ncbi:FecCD family ABC transporter permease [Kaistia nematophila]|uniref:Iron ABC transporter permease n=1 Tax=Kaistia nematophila TaxID=2994654 RepID=A0A9X3DYR3_9HYPH|nr:iron ABC transporter permease [Kaistia nematophila]MCX5568481.1 iron ABC transporter permease [Kaistia nematophila]
MDALTAARPDLLRARAASRWLVPGLVALVIVLFLLSLGVGPVLLSLRAVVDGLLGTGDEASRLIVREIRLPRAILAVAIGFSLGLSGAALQGLLRNPLASPSLFGAPSAAAFGAVLVIAFGVFDALSFFLPIAAMLGALLSVGLLLLIAGPRASLLVIILAGLAISSLAGAATSLALNLAPNPFAALEIAFWLLGSLEDRSMQHVFIALPFIIAGCILLSIDGRAFRALTLGEDAAASLGIRLNRVRLRVVLGVALAVGGGVAVAGTIGFVGLVAPHLVRPFVRHDPARLMWPAALSGAALLTAADILVRIIPAQNEIKVGVVTALIGAPLFIVLVFRHRRELTGEVT